MKAPWRRGPSKLERVLAKHDAIEADIRRRDGVPDPRPFAEQCDLVCTYSGEVGHWRHPDPEIGVICQEMHAWPAKAWFPAPDGMRVHAGCERAARAMDEARAAS